MNSLAGEGRPGVSPGLRFLAGEFHTPPMKDPAGAFDVAPPTSGAAFLPRVLRIVLVRRLVLVLDCPMSDYEYDDEEERVARSSTIIPFPTASFLPGVEFARQPCCGSCLTGGGGCTTTTGSGKRIFITSSTSTSM